VKVVCDTNVLVAGMVAEGLCRDIVKRRLVRVELITSQALLDELARTLRDKFHSEPGEVPLLNAYRERATIVRPRTLPHPVCRDRDDDKVLATAAAGQADIILTGDDDLLVLGGYQGIRILSPRQFVELMDRGG
jgi:putative PIN family toxin of toxin-antitoxin system